LQYKIVVLGDGAIGKTSICMRFCEDHFSKSYKQTIGVDFSLKRVVLPDDKQVSLQIWDIGGQAIGSKMIGKYIFGAQAVLICYDVTNYQSFQNVEEWIKIVKQTFDREPLPYIALVGNKMDLVHLRTVKADKHDQFAAENNMYRYLISAKTGDNINPMFYRIAADLAGVVITKAELDISAKVVKAEIVNHPQHDPHTGSVVLKDESKCLIS